MKVVFSSHAWAQYLGWQAEDPKLLTRLNALIEECRRTPFHGTGKPEPLSGNLKGWWSRRLNREHRLVYRITAEDAALGLEIAECLYCY